MPTLQSQRPPDFFSLVEHYGVFQPEGKLGKDEIVRSVDRAVLYCRENRIDGLVADITLVTGLQRPSVSDLFWFITKLADTSQGKVAVAMVAPAEMITPDKIGITVARNRGLRSEVFTNDADARRWLRSEIAASKDSDGELS